MLCMDGAAALSELPLLAVETDEDAKPSFNRGHLRGLSALQIDILYVCLSWS